MPREGREISIASSLAELWDDGAVPVLPVRLGLGGEELLDVLLGDNLKIDYFAVPNCCSN